ncbi:hypothetical protein CXG81DRAFT_21278 [Caulochytrium protostelioides]|uniref:Uncharacterized protein n=1 Tax=Caulochytrium protostelioides TaxID=1555241 RepID=A0A4P9X0R6_9FUNG|nr:hypothetical protein CXG81DRAFT_21278 [Caulochytrium protostelioides]|eukprot:RKO98495.1 hypothetical protein CXG81DRAFT_21278 [Caulochytrium protostelioides]
MPRQRRPLTPLRHTPRVTAHPSRRTPTSASHTSVRRSLNLHGDGNGSETNDEDNDENRENDVSVAVAAQLAAAAQADATATDAFHAALGPPDSPVPIPSPSQSLANPFWDGGNPHDGDDDHSDMLTHGPPGMLPSHAASRHERWSLSRFASGTDEPVSQSDDDSDCFATPVGVLALNTPLPRRIARTASARRLSVTSPAATVSPPSASKKHRRHSLSTDADTPLSHSEAGSRTRQRWSVGAPSGVAARRSAPATPRVRDSPHAGEASSSSSSSDDSETEVHDTTYRLRRRRSTPRLSRTQQTPSAEPTATPGRSSGRASKKPKLSEQPHGALLTPRPSRSPSPTPSPAGRSRRRRRRRVGHAPDGPSSPPAPVPATRRSRRSLTRSSSRPWPRGAQASPSPGRSESDEPTTAVADGVAAVAPTKAASQDWAAIDAFCLRVESVAGDDETVDRAPVRV